MADPVTKKIDTLADLTGIAASGDKMVVIDASDTDPTTKTKLVAMSQLSIHTSSQLAANVVETTQIKDAAVTVAKLGADAVNGTKIADDSIDSEHYVDGSIDTVHLADEAVTEAKLGAIKRTVIIPIYGDADSIVVANYPRRFSWVHALDGHVITRATVVLSGAVSSSGSVTVTITNAGGTITSTPISVAQGQWSATTTTIVASYKTATSLAPVGINVTAAGTGAKGLSVYLEMLG